LPPLSCISPLAGRRHSIAGPAGLLHDPLVYGPPALEALAAFGRTRLSVSPPAKRLAAP
jgi:hypothetical protein